MTQGHHYRTLVLAAGALIAVQAAAQPPTRETAVPPSTTTPIAGEASPEKHDASDKGINANSQAPLEADKKALIETDQNFLMEAAMADMTEIAASKLAQTQAASAGVKQFADMMVADHGKTSEQLKTLAPDNHAALPTELDAKHAAEVSTLSKLSGTEFDQAYMKQMVKDHQDAVALFQRAGRDAKNAEVKKFAVATLPTLKTHSTRANALYKQLKATK